MDMMLAWNSDDEVVSKMCACQKKHATSKASRIKLDGGIRCPLFHGFARLGLNEYLMWWLNMSDGSAGAWVSTALQSRRACARSPRAQSAIVHDIE
jgi:hypothetical protein